MTRARAKRALASVGVWLLVWLVATQVFALTFALLGLPELTAVLWAAFAASVNHHRRVRARGKTFPTVRKPK